MYSSRVAPGACYVAALCPPTTVSIKQVKIPVCRGGVYTQREVPESDSDWVHDAPEAAAICNKKPETFKQWSRVEECVRAPSPACTQACMRACVHAGLNVSELLRLPGDGNLSLRHKFAAVAAFPCRETEQLTSNLMRQRANNTDLPFHMLRINCVCARVCMRASIRRRRHVH